LKGGERARRECLLLHHTVFSFCHHLLLLFAHPYS
jgi:hypothetical protein